jgi:hypothetical protein
MVQAYLTQFQHPTQTIVTKTQTIRYKVSFMSTISAVHGIVLGSAFMIFFPIGTLIIHSGSFKHAFTYHWVCQLIVTALCFVTVLVGLICPQQGFDVSLRHTSLIFKRAELRIRVEIQFRNFHEPHQILGALLLCCLLLQIAMGYWHHRNYLRVERRTLVSYIHIWVGRLVLVLGIANTRL